MTKAACWTLCDERPVVLGEFPVEVALEAVGAGVYEGFRTFGGVRVNLWGAHALRLEAGRACLELGLELDLAKLGRGVARWLDELQAEHPGRDWKVRLDLAENDLSGLGSAGAGQRILLQAWPLAELSAALLRDGARCAVERAWSREQPAVKGTRDSLRRLRHEFPAGDNYESLLLNSQDQLLEGVMSGLVLRAGDQLRTADKGVLPSITVAETCEFGRSQGLTIRHGATALSALPEVQEAFLATSVRGVVPVVAIAGKAIGTGIPGAWTLQWRRLHLEAAAASARRPDHV